MSNAFKTALQTRLTTTSAFNTAISGRCYYGEAPQGAIYPYLVWMDYLETSDRDTARKFPNIHVQANFYSKTESSSEIGTLVSAYRDQVDDCEASLSITGYAAISVEHLLTRDNPIDESRVWESVVEHKFELQKT